MNAVSNHPGNPTSCTLRLFCPLPPAFKNYKRSGKHRKTGKHMTFTRDDIKERMEQLENAILLELYSTGKTFGEGMEAECMRRLRMLLSALSDDSLNEIPEGSFGSELVEPGQEGITIIIEELL
jgi:hypothetical protein